MLFKLRKSDKEEIINGFSKNKFTGSKPLVFNDDKLNGAIMYRERDRKVSVTIMAVNIAPTTSIMTTEDFVDMIKSVQTI